MSRSASDPIFVSGHALDRARERHAEFFEANGGPRAIVREVGDALRGGRRAKTAPRWASYERRKKIARGRNGDVSPSTWFVWDATETRCYLVRRGPTDRGPGWIVLTVLRRPGERDEAA